MLAPVYHVLPLTTIVRERTLPVAGKVSAHVNQRVNPTDVVAEATFAREHVLLDVARTFGVSTKVADRMIKVNPGDRVSQGALVADAGGLIPRSIRAPRAGRVMIVGSGQILMEVGDARIELRAGLPGVVTQVIPERGGDTIWGPALVHFLIQAVPKVLIAEGNAAAFVPVWITAGMLLPFLAFVGFRPR